MVQISKIGEKNFLNNILPLLTASNNFVNGFGHDISVLDLGFEKFISFKIDRASKPVVITNRWSDDWTVWGKLGVIANLSDHAASGSIAKAAMLSIITPKETPADHIQQIIQGCELACLENNVSFVGGDTKEGSETQVVVATLGVTEYKSQILPALEHQYLYVSGKLGGFTAANIIMKNKEKFTADIIHKAFTLLITPKPQTENSQYLYRNNLVYSATDLSDGLVDALLSFCNNDIGFELQLQQEYFHELALIVHSTLGINLSKLALSVGDWCVTFITNEDISSHLKNVKDLYLLGKFNNSGKLSIHTLNGQVEDMPIIINEQFKERLEDQSKYIHYFE